MSILRIPCATYRLQFNQYFTFQQALRLIDYFDQLGISDCYTSPIFKSQEGSAHGYDVLDYGLVNPEVGTEQEFQSFSKALKEKGMGLLLDIVPNHMCISNDANRWWNDVLENGPSSLYGNHFNIVWDPPKSELKNKVLLPVLDQQYGKVIESEELKVIYENGSFFVDYKERRHFPVNPRTWPLILESVAKKLEESWSENHPDVLELQSILTALRHLPSTKETDSEKIKERNREKEIIKKRLFNLIEGKPDLLKAVEESLVILNGHRDDLHSFDQLEELLKNQAYRLSYWRVTNDEINYKRFFEINDLASMRTEEEEVFEDIHALVFRLAKEGWITGFRVDHVDGLYDPQQYLERLQRRCAELLNIPNSSETRPFYVIVEKILEGDEALRSQWPVFGTTGYDALNVLNGIFVDGSHEQLVKSLYHRFIGRHDEMDELIYNCKKLILTVSMSSELHFLARHLEKVCEQHRWSRDFTLEGLRFALRDIISCFSVYRSYIRAEVAEVSEEDRKYINSAIQDAKALNPAVEFSIFDFIESVLLLQDPEGLEPDQIDYRRQFVMRFQQLTGPVMAKGFEDTALYRSYPLASLNEVGMDPNRFSISLDLFHKKNQERHEHWPHTLVATFTHDTKRSEDVRARINVLSENPQAWEEAINRWKGMNSDKKTKVNRHEAPDPNEEYLFYQTLVGTWPLYPMDAAAHAQYVDRIDKYMNKAIKEAKVHTSWINPNQSYEQAVHEFVHASLTLEPSNQFIKDLIQYIQPILRAGMFNSLSQLLLKMTVPGVPDFYQGSELWEFTLVDPDNRRPVDYSYRQSLLRLLKDKAKQDKPTLVNHLMKTPEDGRIKLYLMHQILQFRREYSSLFQEGNYQPLYAEGDHQQHVIAFQRIKEGRHIVVATVRLYTQLTDLETHQPIGQVIWGATHLKLEAGHYRDVLSGAEIEIAAQNTLPIGELFHTLPMALLEKLS